MSDNKVDNKALHKIGYGLYIVSSNDKDKHNAFVNNTFAMASTKGPIALITINKLNYTHELIYRTKKFNVSMLDETCSFDLIKRFGFQSGRDTDKFEDFKDFKLDENGLPYLTQSTNSYCSCEVFDMIDVGTHTLFLAKVVEAKVIGDEPSLTYAYYHENIKESKPSEEKGAKKGWRCTICGYIYEGEDLPKDFICPICKHGAEDFERIG
ncbi:MAG: flavin reductase [Clostridia bacterium]|nr:flavin reductase [Clostridia bacterium]